VRVCTHTHTCTCTYAHTRTHTHTHTPSLFLFSSLSHTHTHTYTHTHTHIHTPTHTGIDLTVKTTGIVKAFDEDKDGALSLRELARYLYIYKCMCVFIDILTALSFCTS